MKPYKLLLITFLFLGTLSGFSQETLTNRQKQLHRKYDNYYNFYKDSKNGALPYKEWLKKEHLVDDSGVEYRTASAINDSITYRKIYLNDSINTPKEGRTFFNDAYKAYNNKQYADAIRLSTYAINTNINFAFAYMLRAYAKAQLKVSDKDLIPDLTMACNLGVPDACKALTKIRKNENLRDMINHL